MFINWTIAAPIAGAIFCTVLGALLQRALVRRPKLITYFGHASVFRLASTGQVIHTHAVIVKNTGGQPAKNVRFGHHYLPANFEIFPKIPHTVENQTPGGSGDIVLPVLRPQEQVTISYLYFPPLLYSQIHSGVGSDEGFARPLHVLPTPQYSPRVLWALRLLLAVGAFATTYLIVEAVIWCIQVIDKLPS